MTTAHFSHLESRPKRASWFVIVEGVLVAVLGLAALVAPRIAGFAAGVLFGWALVIAGAFGLYSTFKARQRVHFVWALISSLLAIAAGVVALINPVVGAVVLTLVIAAWLVMDGVSSLMIGSSLRKASGQGWIWPIVSALVDWVLAAVLLFLSPIASVVAVGFIVGIDLLLGGMALIGLGVGLRRTGA